MPTSARSTSGNGAALGRPSSIGASGSGPRDSCSARRSWRRHEDSDDMSDAVLVEEVKPGITKVTLNRPERLNAMNHELVQGLHDAFDELAADPSCRVV